MSKETLLVGKGTANLQLGTEIENNETTLRMTVEKVDKETGKVFMRRENLVMDTEDVVATVVGVTRLTVEKDPE